LSSKDNPELLKAAIELKLLDGWRPKTRSIEQVVFKSYSYRGINKGYCV